MPSGGPTTTCTREDDDVLDTLQHQLHTLSPPAPSPRRQLRELQRQELEQQQQQQQKTEKSDEPAQRQPRVVAATAEDLLTAINEAAVEGPGAQAAWSRLALLAADSALLQRAQDLLPGFKFQETVRFLWSLGQLAAHLGTAPPASAPAALRALPAALAPALARAVAAHLHDPATLRWHADRYLLLAGALDGLRRVASHCATQPSPPPAARRVSFSTPTPRPRRPRHQSPPADSPPAGPPPPPTSRRAAVVAAAALGAGADAPGAAQASAAADAVRQASADLRAAICSAAAEELRRPSMTDACVGQLADLLEAISRSGAPGGKHAPLGLVAAADAARAHMRQEHGRYSVGFAAAALRIIAAASGSAAPSLPLLDMARGVAQTAAVQVALAHERQDVPAEDESAALVQLLRGFLLLGFWPGDVLMQAASARLWFHIPRLPAPLLASALSTFATFNYRPCSSFLTAARRRLDALRGSLPLDQVAAAEASLSALSSPGSPAPAISVGSPAALGQRPPVGQAPAGSNLLQRHLQRAAGAPLPGPPAARRLAMAASAAGVDAEARLSLSSSAS